MFFAFLIFPPLVWALQPLPPVRWTYQNNSPGFNIASIPRDIFIEKSFAETKDTEGLTLIPPGAFQFADIFRQDLSQLTGANWTLQSQTADKFRNGSGIFLGHYRGNSSELTYENGDATEEGYEIEVREKNIYIGGSGARGMFWGTRTLLHELLIANRSSIPAGQTTDAPASPSRGYMLDAGRKWYDASFLKELCTYASFFKMSEFHYHSSDNYPLNRGWYVGEEGWKYVYSQFSLRAENNTELLNLIQGVGLRRTGEGMMSRADFEDFQEHCAQRGITVIPEIEAPGHCLSITKWKPELALATKKDLLNLTHPDAIPTVKAIWSEFLPWFQTKEVHIGADEYNATLADDYIHFVNEMASFINSTSGKRVRIWGTNEPSTTLKISKDVIIQHWQYGESDPVQLQKEGYDIINSEDWWAYMSLKNDHTPVLPAPYPQFFNTTRTLNFANVKGWQWNPALFNPINTTEQLSPGASGNKGAILAAWNDNGPDATTQLEAYYAMRSGIPVMAARSWAGARGANISTSTLGTSLSLLIPNAPGQNLDRRSPQQRHRSLSPSSPTVVTCTRGDHKVTDTDTSSLDPLLNIGMGSYGPPYTLTLNISQSLDTHGFELSGPDTKLAIDGATLAFTTSDYLANTDPNGEFTRIRPYRLQSVSETEGFDPAHPGRIWENSTSSHDAIDVSDTNPYYILRIETDYTSGTRVWKNDKFLGRFEVYVYGGRNKEHSWSHMAFVAPLSNASLAVTSLVLEEGIGGKGCGSGKEGVGRLGVAGGGCCWCCGGNGRIVGR
ncbi:glycoside hydrolase [Delitschia confertaspora ATCC 74209]|uniref:beta-N-acetylhexosaminidase n=1 Tax=Delitschia confertaspora ATCC 74209 TaxID=1513339 RepID=A0A9P4JPD1_9PLEO|nr:glycoside hydrolase [Delitschia confertaspora ATCC 74209]